MTSPPLCEDTSGPCRSTRTTLTASTAWASYRRLGQAQASADALARFAAAGPRPHSTAKLALSDPTKDYTASDPGPSASPVPRRSVIAVERGQSSAPAAATFTDVTAAAGISFRYENGATGEYFVIETMGAGVCAFDADGDGLSDLYFTNGHALPAGSGVPNPLYLSNGSGSFLRASEVSGRGTPATEWAVFPETSTTTETPISMSPTSVPTRSTETPAAGDFSGSRRRPPLTLCGGRAPDFWTLMAPAISISI